MKVGFIRLAILLETLFSCFISHASTTLMTGDYNSIKEVLKFAQADSSLVRQARMIAKEYVAKDSIQTLKEGMCCVSIFKMNDDTTSALSVINNMHSRNLQPDTFLYNNVISVCSKVSDWRLAIDILLLMQNRGVASDTISFSSAISACAKAGRWRESLNLLNEMTIAGVPADTICYSSAISACAGAGCWKESLLLLSDMKAKKVHIDTIVYNSAISSCSPSGEWTVALRLMELMRTERLPITSYTYAAAMTACDAGGQCNEVLKLLERMLDAMTSSTYSTITPTETNSMIHNGNTDANKRVGTSTTNTEASSTVESTSTAAAAAVTANVIANSKNQNTYINSKNQNTYTDKITAATVPFNIAITASVKVGRILKAKELFDQMETLGVPRNLVTYTTMITGITKSKNFDQQMVLDVHKTMRKTSIKRNGAIFGAVIAAAEKLDDWVLTLNLLDEMKQERVPTTTFVYHSAISACGKAGKHEIVLELLQEMKARYVERTTVTYSLLITACKRAGLWDEALEYLNLMELDCNEGVHIKQQPESSNSVSNNVNTKNGGSDKSNDYSTSQNNKINTVNPVPNSLPRGVNAALKQDTLVYSSAISVCVESKRWGTALELLEKMEELSIPRNVVTYNTVIEALYTANETARAELVYQSALRTGIYNHWHHNSQHYHTQGLKSIETQNMVGCSEVMDLHNFPISVAKSAVMLVLGEMCTGRIAIADPLIIITGRGNHASVDGRRGILRRELITFCSDLGLDLLSSDEIDEQEFSLKYSQNTGSDGMKIISPIGGDGGKNSNQSQKNPGRLWLTKISTEKWLAAQRLQDEEMSSSGTRGAHGNLFLKVAMAKHKLSQPDSKIPLNVRAVCPFSTATHPEPAPEIMKEETSISVLSPKTSTSVCPASASAVKAVVKDNNEEIMVVKKCPAHAHAAVASVPLPTEKA